MLAFISPNKWFRAKYGEKLRQHIVDNCQIHSITDFGDLPVFKSATTCPMIFIGQNGKINKLTLFTQVKSLESPYPDILAIIRDKGETLANNALNGSNWTLTDTSNANRLKKMEEAAIPLGEYVNGQIYYGVKTGFNKAFVIDGAKRAELIVRDPKSAEIIKPLAVGKDIRKWCIDSKDSWLIVTPIGINIKRYPGIFEHLKQWQKELEKRGDKGKYWWELRACDYYDVLNNSKIVFPDIAKQLRFCFDTTGVYLNNTSYFMPTDDLFLLGVINSSSVENFYIEVSSQIRGGYLRFFRQYVNKIPIPNASTKEREAISNLVQKCLDAKGVGCEAWEKEISDRVAALYGL